MKDIGKYGMLAMNFLKENHPKRFAELSREELEEMFYNVNEEAYEKLNDITKELLKKEPVKDPNNFWETAQHKEQIKRTAEEIVLHDYIYKKR